MKSIKSQIILLMNLITIFSILCIGAFFINQMIENNDEQKMLYREQLEKKYDEKFRMQVETVMSLIDKIHQDQEQGLLTEWEAKKQAADLVRKLRYDDGQGYFWIDTVDGVNVVSVEKNLEGQSRIKSIDLNGVFYIREIIEKSQQVGGGFVNFHFNKPGEIELLPMRAYGLVYKPYDWVIVTGGWVDAIDKEEALYEKDFAQKLENDVIMVSGILVVIQIFVIFLSFCIGHYFAKPIVMAISGIDKFSKGDFSEGKTSMIYKRKDEIGSMMQALAFLATSMKNLIKDISNSAEHVAASSQELIATAEQSNVVTDQVARSINEVANSANEQVAAVQAASSVVQQLSIEIEETAANAVLASEKSVQAARTAKVGERDVDNAIEQMHLIETAVNYSTQAVRKLGDRSKKIGTIVDAISGIAGQTNLLALNAAIEAARAGEHGRGFTVVAKEVGKLAEASQRAAKEIAKLIYEIQEETNHAVNSMDKGRVEVQRGTEVVISAGESFKAIISLVENAAEQSRDSADTIKKMAKGTEQIVNSIRSIDEKTRKVAEESQTVSSATEQQITAIHEITSASHSLATMAQRLQVAVSKFKI